MLSQTLQAHRTDRGTRAFRRVLGVRSLSEGTYVLQVERAGFSFAAGQCASVGVAGSGLNREYSIYSGENDAELEFLVREVQDGTVSPALRKLKPGDEVEVLGPYSEFRMDRTDRDVGRKRFLFVASGTGIAPFHSYVATRPDLLDYQLVHGVRHRSEKYEHEHYGAGRYFACVTRDAGPEDFSGRVTDFLKDFPLEKDTYAFLCGNHQMVVDTYDLLRERGLDNDRIFSEVFF